MRRALFAAMAMVILGAAVQARPAQAGDAYGYVVTCPAGDPIPGVAVKIHVNGDYYYQAWTNEQGRWSIYVPNPTCDPFMVVTAVLGTELHQPYNKPYCPAGRHGTPPNCCIQVVGMVGCNTVGLANLELRCGISGAPPCPSQ
jgi:hypothetical protein